MTIAMVCTLPPYALVGADRLFRAEISDETGNKAITTGHHPKVWVHPDLPVAVASAGIALLGTQPTAEVIQEALNAPIDGDPSKIVGERLRKVLEPIVNAELDLGAYDELDPEHAVVQVFIAISDGRGAGAALLKVGRTSRFESVRNALLPPKSSEAAYANRTAEVLFGRYISDPLRLGEHMRKRIAAGIAESERQLGAEAEAGGEIDVAIVGPAGAVAGPTGARIIPPPN